MDAEAGSSKSSKKAVFSTHLSRKRRRDSFESDLESDHSDEDVYSSCHKEDGSSSMDDSDDSDFRKEDFDDRIVINRKRSKVMPTRDVHKAVSLKGENVSPEASNSTVPKYEVFTSACHKDTDREFKFTAEMRASSPHLLDSYGFPSDIPQSLDTKTSIHTIPLLKSEASDVSPEIIRASSSDFLTLKQEPSSPDLSCDNNDDPLRDHSNRSPPSRLGATTAWSSTPQPMKTFDFTKEQKLLVPPPSDPYEAFRLIIDDDLLDLIVRETNANASRVLSGSNDTRQSKINQWKELTRDELLTFLGLLLHTGTIRLNRISDYWKRHYLFNIQCFRQFMSRNRFLSILRCLNFTSKTSDDRLIKIRPLMDHFNKKMEAIYYPGKQLLLDESMVLWRGRLLFRQSIKNKCHKYGIKLYVLTEPDGTVLKYQIYNVNEETSDPNHASEIVLKLLEEKLNHGHHVYMNDHYNSYGLAVKLLDKQTYCTGTLRKNCKDIPVEIGTIPLRKGHNKSFFLNGVHIGKWRDKRYVLYISTEHDHEMIETISRRGRIVLKPSAIVHYNNCMSGADLQDEMLAYYPIQRKTLRWYKKLFVHMVQMSLSNAMYLYNKYSESREVNSYDFRLKVIESLLVDPKETSRRKVLAVKHELTKIEKTRVRQKKKGNVIKDIVEVVRKECKGCRAEKKRLQTIYQCKQCDGEPGYCTKCFCEAHSSA